MRLDHLLSKEEVGVGSAVLLPRCNEVIGADALRGDTRSHPEHDG